jgi:hypothetical protein
VTSNDANRRDTDVLKDLVSRFSVLPASWLFESDRFVRQQDADIEWMSPEECWLLLFVSHRWETLQHPDPTGQQHRALTALVTAMCDLVDALSADSPTERIHIVPALECHGVLQAAVLLSRLATSGGTAQWPAGRSAREILPQHIKIWYDFACLPQRPRSTAEEHAFEAGLRSLPELFASEAVSLIALREDGDDYQHRGWCLAEALLTANKIGAQGIALRTDRIGSALAVSAPGETPNGMLAERLRAALDGWRSFTTDADAAMSSLQMVTLIAGHSPSEWCTAEYEIAPVYLGAVVATAGTWLGLVLAGVGRQRGQPVDLAALLNDIADRAGVRCALDNDLVYVTLLMLHGISAEGSPLRAFYAECLDRHLSGKPLLVRATTRSGQQLGYESLRLQLALSHGVCPEDIGSD